MRSRIPVLLATIAVLVACLLSGKESLAYNAYIVNSYAATTGNGGNGSVSVTDTTTNKVTATIPVGNNPIGVAVAPDGSKVYVANYGDNTVSVIATTTNKVIATISAGADPRGVYGVAVTPDGRWVYATNQGPSSAVPGTTVLVIDTGTNTVSTLITVGKGPAGVAVSPDGSRVYVSNNSDNTVSVIATASNTVTATIPLSSSTVQPFGIAVTPDGSRVYVGAAGDYISVIDATTNTLSATIGVFGEPQYVAITPDGSKVYVTSADYDRVSVIPTATNMVNTTIEPVSGSRPIGGLGVTPDGSKLYVTDYGGNAVYIIATATNTVTNKQGIRVGAQPNSFGLFIANPPMQSVPASGTACNGVYNGTFNGSLTISAGQDCRFVGGQITGNVTLAGGNFVLSGSSVGGTVSVSAGTYTLGPAATVSGDAVIQNIPTGSDNNSVCGSQISGNLFFDNNGTSVQIGSSSPAVCAGNNIGTSLEANGNTASTLIFNNTVKRNLTASNNTGTLDVVGNNVGGTLTCQNDTNLVMGGGNTAKKRVGQCN